MIVMGHALYLPFVRLSVKFFVFFQCIDCLLEKFREKKITVVTALREAVDACFPAVSVSHGHENRNLTTRSLSAIVYTFSERCLCSLYFKV